MAEAIKVVVRARPFNERERRLGETSPIVSMDGASTTVHASDPKVFDFDLSYPPLTSQERIYEDVGAPLLANAFDGFNVSIFAYGQTGSGKSFTVMGPADDVGMIPRAVRDIFGRKNDLEASRRGEMRVWVDYVEIYNEHLRDLLHPGEPVELDIREHPKLGVTIPKLTEAVCKAPDDVQRLLDHGTKKRATAATQMNASSSRSHAVFTIRIQILEGQRPAEGSQDTRSSLNAKVNLTDLAGSERSSKTGAEGMQLREGCMINQSLSALALIIKELGENFDRKGGSGRDNVVSFRSSKLTFLLKDSLVGNSKTLMFAAVSPAGDNMDETLSTLRFASSVKKIKTIAKVNKDKDHEVIDNLRAEIQKLKEQLLSSSSSAALDSHDEKVLSLEEMLQRRDCHYSSQLELSDDLFSKIGSERRPADTPFLLNLSDDPMLAGSLQYYLTENETAIGSGEQNGIRLKGIGIPEALCVIAKAQGNTLYLQKVAHDTSGSGRVCISHADSRDVRLLQEGSQHEVRLADADTIFLGCSWALRVVIPQEGKSVNPSTLKIENLELAWAELPTKSWYYHSEYLDQVRQQMQPDQAGAFTALQEDVRLGCKLCEEAIEITAACRPDKNVFFEVDLTSALPSCVVIRVIPSSFDDEASPVSYLYLWSLPQMQERLERMKLYYTRWLGAGAGGPPTLDPLLDPWTEPHPEAIALRLRELEDSVRDRDERLAKATMKKHVYMQKSIMLWNPGADEAMRVPFIGWAEIVRIMKSQRMSSRTSGRGVPAEAPSPELSRRAAPEPMSTQMGRHERGGVAPAPVSPLPTGPKMRTMAEYSDGGGTPGGAAKNRRVAPQQDGFKSLPKPKSMSTQMSDRRMPRTMSSQMGDQMPRTMSSQMSPGGRASLNKKGSRMEDDLRNTLRERLASPPPIAPTPEFSDRGGGDWTLENVQQEYMPPAQELPVCVQQEYVPPAQELPVFDDYMPPAQDYVPLAQDYMPPAREAPVRDIQDYVPPTQDYMPPAREANPLLNVDGLQAPIDIASRLEELTGSARAMQETNTPTDVAVAEQLEAAFRLCGALRSQMVEQEQRSTPVSNDGDLQRRISGGAYPRAVYAGPSMYTSSAASPSPYAYPCTEPMAPAPARLEGVSSAGGLSTAGSRIEGLSSVGGSSAVRGVYSAAGGSSALTPTDYSYNASLAPSGVASPCQSYRPHSPTSTLRAQGVAQGVAIPGSRCRVPSGVAQVRSRTPSPGPRRAILTVGQNPVTPRMERKVSPVQVRRQESPILVREASMKLAVPVSAPQAQRSLAGSARILPAGRLVSSTAGQTQVSPTLSPRTVSRHRRYEPQPEVLRR